MEQFLDLFIFDHQGIFCLHSFIFFATEFTAF